MANVFGATSTTDEVLSGVKLHGKRILNALDSTKAAALWKKSEEMVGESF